MLIECPGCQKSYHIVKAALGPMGRRVACPRCDSIWFVGPDEIDAAAGRSPLDAAATPETKAGGTGGGVELEARALDKGAQRIVVPGNGKKAGGKKPPKQSWPAPRRSHGALSAVAFTLTLVMALIGLRTEIVQLWPQAATAYAGLGLPVNLRGLAIDNVRTVTRTEGGETVLGVEGAITNLHDSDAELPALRLTIEDAQGHRLYSWTVAAQQAKVAPHAKVHFRARLAAPPAAGRAVLVEFAPVPTRAPRLARLWARVTRF